MSAHASLLNAAYEENEELRGRNAEQLRQITMLRQSRSKTRQTSYRRKRAIKNLTRAVEHRNNRLRNADLRIVRLETKIQRTIALTEPCVCDHCTVVRCALTDTAGER